MTSWVGFIVMTWKLPGNTWMTEVSGRVGKECLKCRLTTDVFLTERFSNSPHGTPFIGPTSRRQ